MPLTFFFTFQNEHCCLLWMLMLLWHKPPTSALLWTLYVATSKQGKVPCCKQNGSGMGRGARKWVSGVAMTSKFLRSQSKWVSRGCAGLTSQIPGGPTSRHAECAATILVPDTTERLQGSDGVYASMGRDLFAANGDKRSIGQVVMTDRWKYKALPSFSSILYPVQDSNFFQVGFKPHLNLQMSKHCLKNTTTHAVA